MSSPGPTHYLAFGVISVLVLKTLNEIVTEPYMVSLFARLIQQNVLTAPITAGRTVPRPAGAGVL